MAASSRKHAVVVLLVSLMAAVVLREVAVLLALVLRGVVPLVSLLEAIVTAVMCPFHWHTSDEGRLYLNYGR